MWCGHKQLGRRRGRLGEQNVALCVRARASRWLCKVAQFCGVRVSMYVRARLYVYVRACVRACVRVPACVRACVRAYVCVRSFVCACVRARVRACVTAWRCWCC